MLFLTIALIVAISILSDINQNAVVHAEVADGGGNSSGAAGQNPDEIADTVEKFYAYKRIAGCRDESNNHGDSSAIVDSINYLLSPTANVNVYGFSNKMECTASNIADQISILGGTTSESEITDQLKKSLAGMTIVTTTPRVQYVGIL